MYTIVTEWRVTGDPTHVYEDGREWWFPPYRYVWYDNSFYDEKGRCEGERTYTAEQAAKGFVERAGKWKDGPHLHIRTVVYTDWDEVTDGRTETPSDRGRE